MTGPGGGSAADRVLQVADELRDHWAGRRVVLLANGHGRATRALARELTGCGAVIGAVVARAPLPPGTFGPAPVWCLADNGHALRRDQFDAWTRTPPAELARWLDGLDPGRQWPVLGTNGTDVAYVCERPVHSWWRPEWAQWEDKTRIDALWRRAGVTAPPHALLASDDPGLADRAAELDQGRGVVVAVDATDGILGSSEGLRWVRDHDELAAARRTFTRARTLRVTAFVPGVPCSILGMVLPDGVAVFEPFEIITLRDPGTARLVYGGTSTHWRATDATRSLIREQTRAVGRCLAAEVGFRGLFSVDGMATDEAFAATEVNPRHVSGLTLWAGWPRFPMRLFHRAVQEEYPRFGGVHARDVEEAVSQAIRRAPAATATVPVPPGPATDTAVGEFTVTAGGLITSQRLRYRRGHDTVELLDLGPHLPDRSVAPACAALAAAFGAPGLVSFHDESAPSALATRSSS